jgi:hypothetical protein
MNGCVSSKELKNKHAPNTSYGGAIIVTLKSHHLIRAQRAIDRKKIS